MSRYLGMKPFSSLILSSESSTLESTSTLKSAFREFDSIATESALKKPAIGAFILSLSVTFLLSRQRQAL